MSAKAKYEKIDKSKLNDSLKKLLSVMKEKTDNFENEEVVKKTKVEEALDKLIKKYPDAVKKPSKSRTKKSSKAKKSSAKRETVMTVAKRIRKKDESWQDAMKRAKLEMGKSNTKVKKQVDTELEKLKKMIKEDAVLKGFSNSQLQRDAVRKAKPRGKRKSTTKGETTNQYGTFKNKVGRPYWESRENRSDRYAPKYPKNKPFLEDGGVVVGGSTVLRNNADIMDLGIANSDAVFKHGGAIHEMRKEKDIDIYDEQMAKGGTLESKFEGYDSMYNYALANNFTPRQLAEELRFMTNLQNEGDKELYDFLNNLSNMFPDTPVSEFKKGGMMQGYNDRLDESLGMREGREDMMMQSYKDRRNESKGMEKAMGRRAYQSVGTMDKMGMGGYLLAGGTGAYLGAKYPNKVKKVTDPLDKAVEDINRNLKNRYEDGGLVVGGSTVVRNNGDIMPLGTANADAVFQTGGVTAQTVVNPNEAMADLTSTYGFDDVYAKGGRTARGKSGRYHILGESPSAKQPFFYASTDDRASIKSLVSDAKKVFKDLGAKNVEVFVTDQKEDRRIYKNQYAKGGVAEGYSKFRVVFYNYSGETEEKEFDNYSDAYDYYNGAVDDEVGGGTTTIMLQGYSDKYDEFEDIFYFDPMEMSEEDEDFAKGGQTKRNYDYIPQSAIEELSYTMDKVSKSVKGSDVLSGAYVKSKGKTKPKSKGSNDLTKKLLSMTDDEDKAKVILEKDVKELQKYVSDKLITAFYLGLPTAYDFKGDYDYIGGMISYTPEAVKRTVSQTIKNLKSNKFEMGLKYPQYDFEKLLGKPLEVKEIKGEKEKWMNDEVREYAYKIWIWKDCVIGDMVGVYKDGVYHDMNYGNDAKLKGGYKSVQTSKVSKLESIIKFMANDKNGYVKDSDVLHNGLGGATFNALDLNKIKYETGGKIGFEGLSKKVAKRYVGKKVPEKFQNEYGKTYSPAEAKEVGDKVAGAVYRMQQAKKMAKGGSIKVGDKVKYPKAKMIGKVKSIKDLGWEKELTIEYDDGKIIKEGESSVIKLAKGGKTQGYNDKLDESLGNTKGKRSTKEQNYKDRRNESEAMEKKGGKRKYARVKTMDKGSRKLKKPNSFFAVVKRKQKKGEAWKDAIQRVKNEMKK